MLNIKFEEMCKRFVTEFENRITFDSIKRGNKHLNISYSISDYRADFSISDEKYTAILSIPKPVIENGISVIQSNSIKRPISKYYHIKNNKFLDYIDMISISLFEDINSYLSNKKYRGSINTIKHIRHSFNNGNFIKSIYTVQKIINIVVNALPLYTTDMNAWVINNTISIIDDNFDKITNPADKHIYQIKKNKQFFDRGWTSLGISDGNMATKNCMLSIDLRNYSPFGLKFHNPQRNLYSTLGMKGEETPLVMSKAMFDLKKKGITRKGWNLLTVFVDIPDVYEDQLMVDISHKDKYIEYYKKIILYDNLTVSKGDTIYTGDVIAVSDKDIKSRFNTKCDSAYIEDITNENVIFGEQLFESKILHIKYKRFFKDGTKLTNLASNKGVIRMKDLGYAIDPKTGKKRKIDIIVSSKAVLKRKNYTQIIEATINNINSEKEVILPNNVTTSEKLLAEALLQSGYNGDGTWECYTYAGKFNAVCGKVFWGVTHDADDTVWDKFKTLRETGQGIRPAGLKLSTIEFRAIQTRFGENSFIEKEILSYAQGGDDLEEYLRILDSKCGIENKYAYTINYRDIKPVVSKETFIDEEDIKGTFLDESIFPEGFMLRLPIKYQTMVDEEYETLAEGFPCENLTEINGKKVDKQIIIDSIYIPSHNIRKCWRHNTGKYGKNAIGTAINIIILECQKYDEDGIENISKIYRFVCNYYRLVSKLVGGKNGALSVLGMSVRYPNSAKAVATLSNNIPKDTVEIYTDMAKKLKVSTGDVVLVERFPCLGFVSIRPQYVKVTNDPECKFSIRSSGNSLGSLTLDFDGDTLYLASFHTKEAKKELLMEMISPSIVCKKHIDSLNESMGLPRYKEMSLVDYNLSQFKTLSNNQHAEIVDKLSGVKSFTGPVIALAYNILRIAETSTMKNNASFNYGIEVFINTVSNSIFKQKHGVKSLHQIVTDAICTADAETLIKEGFDRNISETLCTIIYKKAISLGIKDLQKHHLKYLECGVNNLLTYIVRNENKLYFVSRSILCATKMSYLIRNFEIVDLPSKIFSRTSELRKNIFVEKEALETINIATKLINIMIPKMEPKKEKLFKLTVGD